MEELKKYATSPLTESEKHTLSRIRAHYSRYVKTFGEKPAGWILRDMLHNGVDTYLSFKLIVQNKWYRKQVLKCL
jgi:hypothetical protein